MVLKASYLVYERDELVRGEGPMTYDLWEFLFGGEFWALRS